MSPTQHPKSLKPPCKLKPGGMQATIARTYVATLQELLGSDQCFNHGHLSDWIYFAETEKDWNCMDSK